MPTIEVSYKELNKLVGRKVKLDDLPFAKCLLEEKDKDTLKIEVSDNVRADLLTIEGIARELKGKYKLEKGIPKYKQLKPSIKIIVDKSVLNVRPYIGGFLVKNVKITEQFLKYLVQVQEKIATTYGLRRKRISIGLYDFSRVNPPLHYTTEKPTFKFEPLGYNKKMSLNQILNEHEKGIEYGYILKGYSKYPIFKDSRGEVLSFPPIINSNYAGRLEPGKKQVFVEVTGLDLENVITIVNVLAQMFYDRGYTIIPSRVVYPNKTITTPTLRKQTMKIDMKALNKMVGLNLSPTTVKTLLRMKRYDIKNNTVSIPFYRDDIIHPVDVYEDVLIALDYNNIPPEPLKDFTVGKLNGTTIIENKARDLASAAGFTEITSAILINPTLLQKPFAKIENPTSGNYAALRNSIVPSLLIFESKNKHVDYPHKVFEVGEVVVKDNKSETMYRTEIRLGLLYSDTKVDFTEFYSTVLKIAECLGIKMNLSQKAKEQYQIYAESKHGFVGMVDNNTAVGEIIITSVSNPS